MLYCDKALPPPSPGSLATWFLRMKNMVKGLAYSNVQLMFAK